MRRLLRGLAITLLLLAGLAVVGLAFRRRGADRRGGAGAHGARHPARVFARRDQRHPAPRRAGGPRGRAAGPAAARLPGVLVDVARAAEGARAGGLPRDRPRPARLRALGQAAAHRGLSQRRAAGRHRGPARRARTRERVSRRARFRRLRRLESRDPPPRARAQARGLQRRAPRGLPLAAAARARARDDELVPDVLPAALAARARAAQRRLVSAGPQPGRIEPPGHLRRAGAVLLQVGLGVRERDPHDARLVPRELPLPDRSRRTDPRVRVPTRIVWGEPRSLQRSAATPCRASPSATGCASSCASRMPATGCSTRSRPRRASC